MSAWFAGTAATNSFQLFFFPYLTKTIRPSPSRDEARGEWSRWTLRANVRPRRYYCSRCARERSVHLRRLLFVMVFQGGFEPPLGPCCSRLPTLRLGSDVLGWPPLLRGPAMRSRRPVNRLRR